MSDDIVFKPLARAALARFAKEDPAGIDQVMDSINILRKNPHQGTRWGQQRRIHVGAYRVMYEVISGDPVIISIEHVGRI